MSSTSDRYVEVMRRLKEWLKHPTRNEEHEPCLTLKNGKRLVIEEKFCVGFYSVFLDGVEPELLASGLKLEEVAALILKVGGWRWSPFA